MAVARLFFRVIEQDDGSWVCRRGREQYDRHDRIEDAIRHMTTIAAEHRPAQIFVHHLDGGVRTAAILDRAEPGS